MAKWTEVDNETGETREVELPDELAELIERALTTAPAHDPENKMTYRTRPGEGRD